MSAETKLLRRAAERLRARVHWLPGAMGDRPWRTALTDSGNLDGVAACSQHEGSDLDVCDGCWVVEANHERAAEYIAMMHPPVALALAQLLEEVAESVKQDGGIVQDSTTAGAVDLARAILRREATP